MGKGNRNSQKRAEEKIINSEKYLEKQKKENNKKTNDKVVSIVLAAFAVLVVFAIVFSLMTDAGVFIRSQSALETSNVEVDAAMMSFFYNDYLMNWYNENNAYLSYFGINPQVSLHAQPYGQGLETAFYGAFDGTWYEFFLEQISAEVELYINYAEGALEAGLELDDEDKESIDELIDNIKASLKESGAKFSDWYGRGVKEKDIRRAYELVFLADNFREYKLEQLEAALEADDSSVYTYVEDNKETFYTADVLSFSISESSKNYENDAAYEAAVAAAKAEAEKFAAAKTPAEFAQLVEAYKASVSTDTSKPSLETDTDYTDEIESLKSTVNYDVPGEDETETADELNNWLFVEEAGENAVKVIEETAEVAEEVTEDKKTESETASEGESDIPEKIVIHDTYKVTVYMVYEPVHIDKSLTKDASFVIGDDKASVEAFRNSFIAESEKTVDKFIELAEKTYEGMHAEHDHEAEDFVEPVFMYNGGEKIPDNYFATAYQPLNDWLDTGALVDGSVSEVLEIKVDDKTTYYAVVFFEQYNDEAWYVNAQSLIINEQFEAWEKAQEEKEPIVVNDKVIMSIPTIVLGGSTTSHEGHDH